MINTLFFNSFNFCCIVYIKLSVNNVLLNNALNYRFSTRIRKGKNKITCLLTEFDLVKEFNFVIKKNEIIGFFLIN